MIDVAWIEATALARALAAAPMLYAAASTVHLIGIATLVGSILAVDLRLLGLLAPGWMRPFRR
ncbi:hypothetical protein [Methylobrevis pamukkalensis]|uniref:Uncharacterized protein n=1 Tax=Methylobrevis pamukkalensis TaxID=1439726 RepID=A0A1E3GWU3_9HYPH|nr:hypothetical protein [Methylobrevis pamukkalensis]ODN68528.1 hypothetical protein A6302_04180 [Methylobrevis pamukkalensis]